MKIVIETILDKIYKEIIEKKNEETSFNEGLSKTEDSQNGSWKKLSKFSKEK